MSSFTHFSDLALDRSRLHPSPDPYLRSSGSGRVRRHLPCPKCNDADWLQGSNSDGWFCHFAVESAPDEFSARTIICGLRLRLRLGTEFGVLWCIRERFATRQKVGGTRGFKFSLFTFTRASLGSIYRHELDQCRGIRYLCSISNNHRIRDSYTDEWRERSVAVTALGLGYPERFSQLCCSFQLLNAIVNLFLSYLFFSFGQRGITLWALQKNP